ncbi:MULTISPECIES: GntR family transcriptional regulator [Rhizobium/Agrobacterium group]|uniref:GntR family transcriptional regulator n=1 Tax=Rhizobium/Agrobacterium group TaxID=227290 RepID=UPI001ADC90DB|nr:MULTISPECIES: GntR family transcriptional regulator [Rhizobium/Agrobacterium group]MBO9112709.1 GntR family transcriptional regulator [Agrobacterium sp. S2/73]QXZ76553.1 GntR family transcriptional regulator [Agrobacterium sp. S7/73]QYA17338.1 GntR family transcriptional regulator [Rhizobium sp. AB2/73]UEQ85669.1 GntR family transcriptional regulator [Rhizobium sp. AB2/73]
MSTITQLSPYANDPETAGEETEFSVYERLRDDIISGRLMANERLKVSELASRMGTSTNPIREALQQLRGEGFVLMTPNRGARVRPIDEDFIRDICEIEVLIEPALTRWFVGIATAGDIVDLERVQAEIEALNYTDEEKHSDLDLQFHRLMYDRHYNRHAVDLWLRHRQILGAIGHGYPTSLSRQTNVIEEHRQLIDRIKAQDADGAASMIALHVEGSGRSIIERLRLRKRQG